LGIYVNRPAIDNKTGMPFVHVMTNPPSDEIKKLFIIGTDTAMPKPCPDCKRAGHAYENVDNLWFVACEQKSCTMMGPSRPTRLEAIQEWDSIYFRSNE
jgi:hypothetical protein